MKEVEKASKRKDNKIAKIQVPLARATMSASKLPYKRAENSGNDLARAIRHPANFEPLLVCTIVLMVVGILMMICGGIICLIYYTEITPPNFDTNYHRYVGSSVPRIVGPLLAAFGAILTIGDIIMICFAVRQIMKSETGNEGVETKRLGIN